jgi:VanZ family protein
MLTTFRLKIWSPVLIIAGLIFFFSSQPYEKQDLKPSILSKADLSFVEKASEDVSFEYAGSQISIESKGTESFVEFFIRKGAHVTIYLLLGFFFMRALRLEGILLFKATVISLLFIASYAASDEIHQHYTGNRTPLVEDVLLDFIGGTVGIILMTLIIIVKKKTSSKAA